MFSISLSINIQKLMQKPKLLIEEKLISTVTVYKNNFNFEDVKTIYSKQQLPTLDTSFKAFMDYRYITDKSSSQWALQQLAYTDENGLRKIEEYYCVAVGSYFTEKCGKKFLVILENGQIIPVIVADLKSNKHTDKSNLYTPLRNKNNQNIFNKDNIQMVNIIEFIVDTDKISSFIKNKSGDISDAGEGVEFAGEIKMILKI